MNILFNAALEIQNYFKKQKWQFCFIGGLAVLRWGEPRMTQDIDVSLFTGFGNEKIYIKKMLDDFKSRIPDAFNFAVDNRVLLLFTSKEVPVDISLSGLPFEKQVIRHATKFLFAKDCCLVTCSAEDLIILKAFADRPIDWFDIQNIVYKQSKKLNVKYIYKELKPLCSAKESPEIIDKLTKILTASK